MILLGMFLGGYPTGISPDNVYRFFPVVLKEVKPYFVYHSIGAFLMVAGLDYLDLKLLKRRLFLFLEKYLTQFICFIFRFYFHFQLNCLFASIRTTDIIS